MLGKTHMAAGAALSLAVLQPSTVSGCICAVAGGVIGGWICDIDVRSHSVGAEDEDEEEIDGHGDERWQILVFVALISAICFTVDFFAGNGMCEYISHHLGIPMFVAVAVFLAFCVYGVASAHRTAMHSILGGIILSGAACVICAPLAPAFALGYSSHVILDLFNKRRIQLFWPAKVGIKFGICKSNGVANNVIGAISLIACLILLPMFLVPSLGSNENFVNLFESGGSPSPFLQSLGMSRFQLYLLAINIITFLVYFIDYLAWERGAYGDDPETDRQDFVHTIFLLLPAAGGALGMLLAVIIGTGGKLIKGENGTIGFYTHGLCFLVVWICIYIIFCDPFGFSPGTSSLAALLKERNVILTWFVLINVVSFVVFLIDGKQHKNINVREVLEFALAFLGGATGAYLAMVLTGHKMNTAQFGQGTPLMMAMHFVILAIGRFNGYL